MIINIKNYNINYYDEPVKDFYEYVVPKSIGNGMTFKRDLVGEREVYSGVSVLADSVASRLRHEKMKCTVVSVVIRDPSFAQIQRQHKIKHPTYLQREITEVAMDLIRENWDFSKPIRLITITGSELVLEDSEYAEQTSNDLANKYAVEEDKFEGKFNETYLLPTYGEQPYRKVIVILYW